MEKKTQATHTKNTVPLKNRTNNFQNNSENIGTIGQGSSIAVIEKNNLEKPEKKKS